uniref:Mitochondrial-processing peptidase subunit beta n=1 Tax=Steinernema glaseri TaxID=37863 RepID=A0A1I8A848_9BILA
MVEEMYPDGGTFGVVLGVVFASLEVVDGVRTATASMRFDVIFTGGPLASTVRRRALNPTAESFINSCCLAARELKMPHVRPVLKSRKLVDYWSLRRGMATRLLRGAALFRRSPVLLSRNFSSAQAAPSPVIVDAPSTKVSHLPSGFTIASESRKIPTATVGIWIDAGSRYENERNNGVAHFLEHMAFKGTAKRTQYDLEIEVENIGAHLNAYTSREQTVYYAKCFSKDIEQCVEILSDILTQSRYENDAITRERSVILREMEEVEQDLQEVVFDHLHSQAYKGTSLSRTILGPEKNIKSISREDLVNYVSEYYKGPRMMLAGAGGVDHDHLVELAAKYFGNIEHGGDKVLDYEAGVFSEAFQRIEKPHMELTYGSLAVEGTSWTCPDNIPLMIANTMIGQYDSVNAAGVNGPSRLLDRLPVVGVNKFMAYNTCYKDTGLAGVYFICSPDACRTMAKAICDEWQSLCESVSEEDVERGKRLLLTNMLLMLDGSTPICEDIGRQMLCYGRRIPIHELHARIDAVTPDTIRDAARRVFLKKPVAFTVVGQTSSWPRGEEIKSWLQ